MMIRWLKRPQWSLRSFLIVFAIFSGWLAWVISAAQESPITIITNGNVLPIQPLGDEDFLHLIRNGLGTEEEYDFSVARIFRHKVVSRVMESPRVYPLFGLAAYHQEQYRCILIGHDRWVPRIEVLYVNRDHLQMLETSEPVSMVD